MPWLLTAFVRLNARARFIGIPPDSIFLNFVGADRGADRRTLYLADFCSVYPARRADELTLILNSTSLGPCWVHSSANCDKLKCGVRVRREDRSTAPRD
jgi:hypothetical protein